MAEWIYRLSIDRFRAALAGITEVTLLDDGSVRVSNGALSGPAPEWAWELFQFQPSEHGLFALTREGTRAYALMEQIEEERAIYEDALYPVLDERYGET